MVFFWNQDSDGDFESLFGKISETTDHQHNFNIAREIEGDRQQGACKNDGENMGNPTDVLGMCSN